MEIYRRYFEIKDAATLARIAEIIGKRMVRKKAIAILRDALGAKAAYWSSGGRVRGFDFATQPDMSIWKRAEHGYLPRLNTKAGKAVQAQIDALGPAPGEVSDALEAAGLDGDVPCLFGDGKAAGASICGWHGGRWFAVVPWYDEDPAKLEAYKAQRGRGSHMSRNLDHLLWTPPAEWMPLKEWEVQKALDEAKEAA